MTPDFDLENVEIGRSDFYVTQGRGKTPKFDFVRIDNSIREALVTAARDTWGLMQEQGTQPEPYDPANDYPSTGFLYVPLDEPLVEKARYLHEVENPEEVTNPLDVLPRTRVYLARLLDRDGKSLTAAKNTSSFGRPLARGRLASLTNGELHVDEEPKFQLSSDFDFMIDSQNIFIYRHKSFEQACNLEGAIGEAVKENIGYISQHLGFIDFSFMEAGLSRSLRAARELAAIKANDFGRDISQARIVGYCTEYNIDLSWVNGRIYIEDADNQMKFLRLLSRKILEIELRDSGAEVYAVSSRKPL